MNRPIDSEAIQKRIPHLRRSIERCVIAGGGSKEDGSLFLQDMMAELNVGDVELLRGLVGKHIESNLSGVVISKGGDANELVNTIDDLRRKVGEVTYCTSGEEIVRSIDDFLDLVKRKHRESRQRS